MRWRFFARKAVMLLVTLLVASFVIFGGGVPGTGEPARRPGRQPAAAAGQCARAGPALSPGPAVPGPVPVLARQRAAREPGHLDHATGERVHADRVPDLDHRRAGPVRGTDHRGAGTGLGIVSGLRPGRLDTSTLVATAVCAAIPAFVAAIALIGLFAVKLRWFPALGNGTGLGDNVRHFTLPAIALATASLAIVARVTRAAVRAESDAEHVQTAISRGIPARYVIQRHVLRNAAIPITTIAGITVASLIAVAAVVELAFSLNGLGAYLVQAAQTKDIAVVQGISLVLVTAFVMVNLLVDMLYAVLDPRVAPGGRFR